MRFDSAIADRVTAIVFFALGAAMTYGGLVMDRLEVRQIHPASIPGLVPMILGVALMVCAGLLAWGTRAKTKPAASDPSETERAPGSWENFAVVAFWSAVYALGLVGGMPFAIATAIYICVFSAWFTWRENTGIAGRYKTLIFIGLFGCAMAAAISALFRYGFLVRLP